MVYLREAKPQDMMLIYEWANDPVVRAQSFNSEPIPLENHKMWYEKVLKNDNILFYILTDGEHDLGQIRLSIEDNKAVISYMIASEARGKGYGKSIINLALKDMKNKKTCVTHALAEVKKDNTASVKVFESCGFKLIENDTCMVFEKEL